MAISARGYALAVFVCAVTALGCDAGGLLVVEKSGKASGQPVPSASPPASANEFVSGGSYAKNDKYRLFFVVGQPTPNQGVATSPDASVHGGLAGAVHPD